MLAGDSGIDHDFIMNTSQVTMDSVTIKSIETWNSQTLAACTGPPTAKSRPPPFKHPEYLSK